MCGRFSLSADVKEIEQILEGLQVDERVQPRVNISPGQAVMAVVADPQPRCEFFQWGLIPPWAKEPAKGIINARAETLSEKAAFKQAYRRKRCAIPADGWYEWKGVTSGKKQPWRFCRKDRNVFAMAGLWEEWHDKEGGYLLTVTIITTRPNQLARKIHHRMPALLREEDVLPWLSPVAESRDLSHILEPVAGDEWDLYKVNPALNRSGVENPEWVQEWTPPPEFKQPELF